MKDTLGVLLAGGVGERLYPLTQNRAKPAVPFGGIYRIIDVTLSNCINSDLRKIFILTQYKALSPDVRINSCCEVEKWIRVSCFHTSTLVATREFGTPF